MDKYITAIPKGNKKRKNDNKSSSTFNSNNINKKVTNNNKDNSKINNKDNNNGLQMFLDYGQKSFGANKICDICEMLYIIGDLDDEKRHKSYCEKIKDGPTLSSTNGYNIIAKYQSNVNIDNKINDSIIIEIKPDQKLKMHDSILKIFDIVRNELGSSDEFITGNDVAYLYLSGKSIVGCLVIEKVNSNVLVKLSSTVVSTDVMAIVNNKKYSSNSNNNKSSTINKGKFSLNNKIQKNDDEIIINDDIIDNNNNNNNNYYYDGDDNNIKQVLGIRQIWVNKKYRRQGIAEKMIDSARKCFTFGTIIDRSEIAFSQPTNDGLAFALAYTKNLNVLAYS